METTWRVRIEVAAGDPERLVAELWSLGTLGLEETESGVVAYFAGTEPPRLEALREALPALYVHEPEPVEARDWEREWRRGLRPRRIGPLWIRPSWCESPGEPELVIDPRQAFGSGEHATTRMSLELLLDGLRPGDRVLDVGTGSGILLLGALRFGAVGVGVEIDPVACANARENALANGLDAQWVAGGLEAVAAGARFDHVVANMLWSRLEPLLPRVRAHARGRVVLSGYLESERELVRDSMRRGGGELDREASEPQSGDVWCASRWIHARDLQSSSSASSIDSKE